MPATALLRLPARALLILASVTPLVALLFDPDPEGLHETALASARSVVAVWAYSMTVAGTLHLVLARIPATLAPGGRRRFIAIITTTTATTVMLTWGLGPLWRLLDTRLAEDLFALSIRGTLVAQVYVHAGWLAVLGKERADEARRAAAVADLAAWRAKVQALQARTNPHFLFNSLNAVLDLMATNPQAAEDMLVRLSAVFRYVLEASEQSEVRLGDEFSCIEDYLAIHRFRFGSRMVAQINFDPELVQERTPPLLLLPLVENAMVHAVARSERPVLVEVLARCDKTHVLLSVRDDAVPAQGASSAGSGTALRELRARLHLAYADAASLDTSLQESGYLAKIQLPRRGLSCG